MALRCLRNKVYMGYTQSYFKGFLQGILIILLLAVGCISHFEAVHIGQSSDSEIDSQIDKAGVVNITPIGVKKGVDTMNLATFGIYSAMLTHLFYVVLLGIGMIVLVWALTKYVGIPVFLPKMLLAGLLSIVVVAIRIFIRRWVFTAPVGEIIVDQILALVFAHYLFGAVWKRKLFKRD